MENKQIILDISRLVWRIYTRKIPTGVDRVCLEYIKHYCHRSAAAVCFGGKYYFLQKNASKEIFQLILNWNEDNFKLSLTKFVFKLIMSINFKLKVTNTYILNIGHTNIGSKKKYDGLKLLFMLYDLIPLEYPEYDDGPVLSFKKNVNFVLKQADAIICISKDTEGYLHCYAQCNQIKKLPQISVALLGTELRFKKRFGSLPDLPVKHINHPYFVILSTIGPRKNHIMLLNIWRRIIQDVLDKNIAPNLIIIGNRGWKYENVANMLEECEVIKENVFELNCCSDLELQAYLTNARALLFPSFAEGYGLPLVEALQLGTPVIVSDITVFHELGNDIPEYIDPLDGISWMNMILEYTKPDSIMRAKQIERIQGYKVPTWEDHFKIVDEVLDKR